MSHTPEATTPSMPPASRLKDSIRTGFQKGIRHGLHGFWWITRILVPVSLAVALLDWTGWLYALDPVFSPVMALINLPPQAALPIISALFSSFYAAVAMMVVIPFTDSQFILMALFISICHMIVVEGLIQHKAGINGVFITVVRLAAACLAVFIASQFLPGTEAPVVMPANLGGRIPLSAALLAWALSTIKLMLKILAIIVPVMIVLELLKELGYTNRIANVFRPFMLLLGLPPNVATMWVTGTFFGLIYGSAVIVEESTSGRFTEDELTRLHISLGISHSMVEDPALFLALGVGLQWTVLPRLLAAAFSVHLYRLSRAIGLRLRPALQSQEL